MQVSNRLTVGTIKVEKRVGIAWLVDCRGGTEDMLDDKVSSIAQFATLMQLDGCLA